MTRQTERMQTEQIMQHPVLDRPRTPPAMSRPVKRSFTLGGHRTSISLEAPFWDALKHVARELGMPVARLVQDIDGQRGASGLSSAVRVWLLHHYMGLPKP